MEDNIKMYLKEIRWEGIDLVHMTQNVDQRQIRMILVSVMIPRVS
jgi:hypothetical protein